MRYSSFLQRRRTAESEVLCPPILIVPPFPRKSRLFICLPPLVFSWLSFSHSFPLFSAACPLFSQYVEGVGYLCDYSAYSAPARPTGGPQRYPLPLFLSSPV